MTLANRALLGLIAVELVAGGVAASIKMASPRPPQADLAYVDEFAAADLRAIAASIRTAEDWRHLGEGYMATGFYREAEACHRVAASREPDNAEAAQQWAYALERLGSLDASNIAYARAAELDPTRSASCHYLIARNKLRQEDVAGARQAFEEAGDFPAARYELARLLVREGRRDEAVTMLNQLAGEFPAAQQPALLLHLIALTEQRLGDASAAADRQDAARTALPNPFTADFQRLRTAHEQLGLKRRWMEGRRLVESGKPAAAEQILRSTLAARFDAYAADWLAEALFQQGSGEEAVKIQEELIQRTGPKVEYLERLGDTLDALGRKDEARTAWLRATQLSFGPPLRDVHGKLAESLAKAGQQHLATQHFAQAALAAGIAEFRASKLPDAERALREAVRLDAQLAHAWYYLGEAARQRDDTDAARTAYDRCLSIQPHHGRAADRLELLSQAVNGQ